VSGAGVLHHLPILQVLVPLLAAPVALLLRRGYPAWVLATGVSWLVLVMAMGLVRQVLINGTLSYELGGWAPPWGIEYRVDVLGAFMALIVSGIAAVIMPFSRRSLAAEIPADRSAMFYTLILLCLTGLLGIVMTGDAFNLFVFLEVSSLSSYALISMGRRREALTAAFQYLIMGTIGATAILIGVGLLYMMTGTLNMADLAERMPDIAHTRTVTAAFAFIVVGVALKTALFPLHLWLPNAYTYAPSVVSAFLAATATKVGVYMLLRFSFTIFGGLLAFEIMNLDRLLLVLALLAALYGSTAAVFQTDLKRMLAYSSVAQIGYTVAGVSFASLTGLTAGIVHLFNHALVKGGLFLVAGCVLLRIGNVTIERMAGLGRTMPWTMAAFVVGGLGLVGVPATAGFISKWYLVQAALERGWWPVAVVVLFTSLLAAVYVWRVVEVAYFRTPAQTSDAGVGEAPLSMLVSVWVMLAIMVYFGINASLTTGLARQAASGLLGTAL